MKLAPPNNTALPELNGFAARSFWLQLLTVVAMVLNSQGIDIWAALREAGIGGNPAQVLATGDRIVSLWQQALPIVTGLWAYFERRAPHYRLVWPWRWGTMVILWVALMGAALLPGSAFAAGPQCAERASVTKLLADKYGEHALGGGIADNKQLFELYWYAATGSWTATVSQPNGTMCLVASGQGWTLAPQPVAEGDPT
jgi:hypothetical protein